MDMEEKCEFSLEESRKSTCENNIQFKLIPNL